MIIKAKTITKSLGGPSTGGERKGEGEVGGGKQEGRWGQGEERRGQGGRGREEVGRERGEGGEGHAYRKATCFHRVWACPAHHTVQGLISNDLSAIVWKLYIGTMEFARSLKDLHAAGDAEHGGTLTIRIT